MTHINDRRMETAPPASAYDNNPKLCSFAYRTTPTVARCRTTLMLALLIVIVRSRV